MSGPSAEHIDAVARIVDAYPEALEDLLTTSDPAVHAAMLDALVRAGVLREDWCVNETAQPWRYYMRDEETARESEGALPGTVAERRYVTEWEVSGQ